MPKRRRHDAASSPIPLTSSADLSAYLDEYDDAVDNACIANTRPSHPQHAHNHAPYLILYEITCPRDGGHEGHEASSIYLDHPRLFKGDSKMSALRGREKVKDISKYLEQHKEVNFVVRKYFDCQEYIDNEHVQKLFKALPTPNDPKIPDYILPLFFSLQDNGPLTIQSSETVEILSEPLRDAVVAITGMGHEEVAYLETPRNVKMLQDSIYYFSRLDKGIVPRLTTSQQLQLSSVLEYMQWAHGHAYKEADALISQGLIKREYLAKIFGSNQPLVTNVGGHHRAYMLESPPSSGGPRNSDSIVLRLCCWHFNGKFHKEHEEWTLSWPPSANEDAEIPISGLEIYPLRYAAPHVAKQLKARGETFWKGRKARFVAYDPPNSTLKYHTSKPRYMVDVDTYQQMHGDSSTESSQRDTLSPEAMQNDDPPLDDSFIMLLSHEIHGFGMHDKKWS